jgi:hypothetical protein
MPLFRDDRVGVVYCSAKWIREDGEQWGEGWGGGYFTPHRGAVTPYFIMDNFVYFSSSVVRRECFEKVGLFDESLAMGIDWDLWLRISIHYNFDYVDESLIRYRSGHSGQMSGNLTGRLDCAMAILSRFLAQHANSLPRSAVRSAWAYAYCNRGMYHGYFDSDISRAYYLKAIRTKPTYLPAWFGLARNIFSGKKRAQGQCTPAH